MDRQITPLDAIREALPDYARDLKLNLGSVLDPSGAPGPSETQCRAVALAAALPARVLENVHDAGGGRPSRAA